MGQENDHLHRKQAVRTVLPERSVQLGLSVKIVRLVRLTQARVRETVTPARSRRITSTKILQVRASVSNV